MADNRIVVINRRVASINDPAVANIYPGEWFVTEDTNIIYWKDPTTNTIKTLGTKASIVNSTRSVELPTIGTLNIDPNIASVFYTTLTGNATINIANVNTALTNEVSSFILEITNGGQFAVNWMAGIKWDRSVAPLLSANKKTIIGFYGLKRSNSASYLWTGTVLTYEVDPV